jgi:RNA polymerase-associated protein CTR9
MGHIFVQQGRTEKALDNFKRATKLNQRDVDAWLEMGELLVLSDFGEALEAFKMVMLFAFSLV